MKKINSYFLSLIILLQSGGVLFIAEIQKEFAQHQMLQLVSTGQVPFEKKHLLLTTFNQCKVNAHEILWDGKMYDIVKGIRTTDSVSLLLVNDKSEDLTLAQLKKIHRAQKRSRNNKTNKLTQLVLLNYISQSEQIKFNNIAHNLSFRLYNSTRQTTTFIAVPYPPPKHA